MSNEKDERKRHDGMPFEENEETTPSASHAPDPVPSERPTSALEAMSVEELLKSGILGEEETGFGFSVVPKKDCPHVIAYQSIVCDASRITLSSFDQVPCKECGDGTESWLCLHCQSLYCSRYVKGHAAQHAKASGHQLAVSLSDLSVWCYGCDAYIEDKSLRTQVLSVLEKIKFPPETGGDFTKSATAKNKEKENISSSTAPEKSASAATDHETSTSSSQPSSSSTDPPGIETTGSLGGLFGSLSLGSQSSSLNIAKERANSVLQGDLTLSGIAKLIQNKKCKNIIVMSGAGISVGAGIPDFRTPGTGLYDNLQKYNLPHPTAVFELDFFKTNPKPFCLLARELYPGNFQPTPAHYFVTLLHKKGVLLRNYTQNIDTLEREAGVPGEKLVEAHGSFASAHCVTCKRVHTQEFVRKEIFAERVPRCLDTSCQGLVKPDIIFFGESLPARFHDLYRIDFPQCDLLIVMGTSLQVQPFASLIDKVGPTVPRLLLNMEKVATGPSMLEMALFGMSANKGFKFDAPENTRDVYQLGDVQTSCVELIEKIGWKKEFEALIPKGDTKRVETSLERKTSQVSLPVEKESHETSHETSDSHSQASNMPLPAIP